MIGTYTKNFGTGGTVETALRAAGLSVQTTRYMGGAALRFAGRKPA